MNDPSAASGAVGADLPFRSITALIREHAQAAPRHPALVDSSSTLDYGSLDALMDRVAASLQRDGVAAGRLDRDLRRQLDALRGDLPGRAARRRRRRAARRIGHAGELSLDARRRRRAPALRRRQRRRGPRRRRRRRPAAPHLARRQGERHRFRRLARRRGQCAARRRDPPRDGVQHHLFVGNDRHAEGHRPAARHALDARDARRPLRLLARDGDAAGDAALLEHDAGRLLPDHRLRRHGRADGEVRRRPLPRARRAPPRHATRCWCRCSTSG